jgi:uncharacterized membrane protein
VSGRRRAGESGARDARSARVAVIVVCLAALSLPCVSGCTRGRAKYPEVRALDGTVSIVTEDLAAGSARFYTFRDRSGRTADFFVYRESGGATRAALDSCRTCARWKKGYRLEGGKMVCIYCGMRFDLDTLAKGIGSCIPIALPVSPAGDRIHVAAEGLEEGLRYF